LVNLRAVFKKYGIKFAAKIENTKILYLAKESSHKQQYSILRHIRTIRDECSDDPEGVQISIQIGLGP